MSDVRPAIAITMGDPLGIGPEVVVKALASRLSDSGARFVIYGHATPMLDAARKAGINPFWQPLPLDPGSEGETRPPHAGLIESPAPSFAGVTSGPTRQGGAASFDFLERAIADSKRHAGDPRRVDAIVTAPISKEAWALAGHAQFPGHTELLAARYSAPRVRMMFVASELRVMLVTTHVPLRDVPRLLTVDRIVDTLECAHESCQRLGIEAPRIAVCGINPHAGEAGLLGDEEVRVVTPAMRAARERGIHAYGPFPGDTVFNAARRGTFDLVVAMYHDQGLIPVKLLAFDRAVNYSAGLPVVRTSPDHGTAYDIAGTNRADPGSMGAAIDLAIALVKRGARDALALQ